MLPLEIRLYSCCGECRGRRWAPRGRAHAHTPGLGTFPLVPAPLCRTSPCSDSHVPLPEAAEPQPPLLQALLPSCPVCCAHKQTWSLQEPPAPLQTLTVQGEESQRQRGAAGMGCPCPSGSVRAQEEIEKLTGTSTLAWSSKKSIKPASQ